MHSLKRFFAMLFLCGLLVPSCYAGEESGPPQPNTPMPSEPAPAPGGGDSSPADDAPSDPGPCPVD